MAKEKSITELRDEKRQLSTSVKEIIAEARAAFPDMTIGIGLELGDTREERADVIINPNDREKCLQILMQKHPDIL